MNMINADVLNARKLTGGAASGNGKSVPRKKKTPMTRGMERSASTVTMVAVAISARKPRASKTGYSGNGGSRRDDLPLSMVCHGDRAAPDS